MACLQLVTNRDLSTLSCVDIGCGSGGISYHLAPHFERVCGVDPEPWQRWQDFTRERPNLSFREESIESLSLPDASVDVVICNQVYEHVPSPRQLIAQIHRILKPGGTCYFAGPNLLYPIEPHVSLPFVHWIPRRWALALLGVIAPGKKKYLDAYSTTYWTLRRWLSDFVIVDAIPPLVRHHAATAGGIWAPLRLVPAGIMKLFAFLSPGFIFVLTRPGDS